MNWCRKLIECLQPKAVLGFVFFFSLAVNGHAQLGASPTILIQPLGATIPLGGTAIISATVAPSLTPQKFYWFFNGQPIATNSDLTVSNATNLALDFITALIVSHASSNRAGIYSLRVTNGIGAAVSSNATLVVLSQSITNVIYFVGSGIGLGADGFRLELSGPPGSNFVIQASSDLKKWVSISTNPAPTGDVSYLDDSVRTNSIRFYRAFIQ